MQQRTLRGAVRMAVLRLHREADSLSGLRRNVLVMMQRQQQYQRPVAAQHHEGDTAVQTGR